MVEAYTGTEGILEIAGSPIAVAAFTLKVTRGVASHPRSGHHSDLKLPGKVDVTGTISRIMIDGAMLGKVVGDTEETGESVVSLHAGLTAPGDGEELVTDMTDPDSKSSLIKFTALTTAVTAVGKAILYGTDINGNELTEVVTIPLLAINGTVTGKKIFKTLTHVVTFDYVHANDLQVDAVVGASGIGVGEAKIFKIEGQAISGDNHVYVIADNCFLTDGEFAFSDADTILSDTLSFTMKDPDADLTVVYV